MPSAPCPFCFNRINTAALWYQCTGNGRVPCVTDADEARIALLKRSDETYPTFRAVADVSVQSCPKCACTILRRACPECHMAVPEALVGSDSPMVGVVGTKGSGKTVYVTSLVKELRKNVSRRFAASVRFATDNPDGFASVSEYEMEREDPLFDDGILPPGTPPNTIARRNSLVMLWQGQYTSILRGTRIRSTLLSFVDSAGEDFGKQGDVFTLRYLTVCSGLVLALDPFSLPGARSSVSLHEKAVQRSSEQTALEVLGRVTELLRVVHKVKPGKKIGLPLAVVFTKMDAFFSLMDRSNPLMTRSTDQASYGEADGEAVHEHMLALLHSWRADDVDQHLRFNYRDFRYFGVSALGAEPDYDAARTAPGGVRPHRVEDPVLWLLAKQGTVRSA
ncbi:hypothetical protein GCM10027059_37910 [Myceligenerans halotolerans]